MVGEDALDLLHRLSTQDLLGLQPGEGSATILTTDKGRILDTIVVQRHTSSLLLLVSPGNQKRVLEWLDKYTIMEDSEASDVTEGHRQLLVFGPAARAAIVGLLPGPLALSFSKSGPEALQLYHHRYAEIGGGEVVISSAEAPAGDGFHIVASAADIATVRQTIVDAGVAPIDADVFEVLRIEAGLPAFGSEIDERFNPHEAELGRHISYTKGCYIGQEVIARLDTYDKVQRHLLGLRAQGDTLPEAGSKLLADGKDAGLITSVARSPAFGPIALAYIRRAHVEPGTRLVTDAGVEVQVAALPFA